MYNVKDIQFVGKHDFYKESALTETGWNQTFSLGIFQWELKGNKKAMKKGKVKVRVSGDVKNKVDVFNMAEKLVNLLDSNEWDGRKNVKIGEVKTKEV